MKREITRGGAGIWSVFATIFLALLLTSLPSPAQTPAGFGVCVPRSQRVGNDVGCFIVTEQAVGSLSAPVFWHVTRFDSREQAEAARPANGTILDAFDKVWLMVIADARWRSPRGTHVAAIGPLPVTPGTTYSALYMEASMRPGMKSAVHTHSGPEAWYTLSGETCLETPAGTQLGRAHGAQVIVPAGLPMELTATGTTLRRSLVLILHDSSQPPTTPEATWAPKGLCKG
jgi:quercetin dioxygenase-like cupin family protein